MVATITLNIIAHWNSFSIQYPAYQLGKKENSRNWELPVKMGRIPGNFFPRMRIPSANTELYIPVKTIFFIFFLLVLLFTAFLSCDLGKGLSEHITICNIKKNFRMLHYIRTKKSCFYCAGTSFVFCSWELLQGVY